MAHAPVAARPRVGVVKFASCDGCQLTLLDLEDELLSVVEHFDIVDFPEATSARSAGPYDVLFVEGSVSEPAHLERIVELRRRTDARHLEYADTFERTHAAMSLTGWKWQT